MYNLSIVQNNLVVHQVPDKYLNMFKVWKNGWVQLMKLEKYFNHNKLEKYFKNYQWNKKVKFSSSHLKGLGY
jgi:hypothetical protein